MKSKVLNSALRTGFLLSCIATFVVAHEHHDEVTEEEEQAPIDTILWLHIFLQAAVWGILFPIGMVLGLSRSRWHVPLQVRKTKAIDEIIYLPTRATGNRFPVNTRRLHSRALSQRTCFSGFSPWQIRQYHGHPNPYSAGCRNLPETPHPRKINTTILCRPTRNFGQMLSHTGVAPNAFWSRSLQRVLSWRSLGFVISNDELGRLVEMMFSRAMSGSLYHGQWLHRLCCSDGYHSRCWRAVDAKEW